MKNSGDKPHKIMSTKQYTIYVLRTVNYRDCISI